MEAPKLCVICCAPFTSSKARGDPGYSSLLQKLDASKTSSIKNSSKSKKLTLFGCPECLTCVNSALESKEQVMEVEESVSKVQLLILKLQRKVVKLLRELKGKIGGFKEVVGGLEGILEESGDKVGNMDGFFGQEESGLVKEAIQFRDGVLAVIRDVILFKTQLEIKSNDLGKTLGTPCPSLDNREESVTRPSSSHSKKRARTTDIPPDYQEVSKLEEENEPENADDDDDCHSGSEDVAMPLSPESCGSPGDEDEERDDDDEEYVPVKKSKTKLPTQMERHTKDILSKVDFTGMTPYKKSVITLITKRSIRKKLFSNRTKGNTTIFDDLDPLKLHPSSYDPTTDSITMGGIHLKINEQDKCIQCSECGLQIQPEPPRNLYSHVLGFHLNLLQCPYCPSKITDYICFKAHVLSHAGKYTCDICGKQLKRADVLRCHKWTHKNEEEKQEAIRNGVKPPNSYWLEVKAARSQGKQGALQCATCGKGGFSTKYTLQEHEKLHQAPKHICPQCGKIFSSKTHLWEHQKFFCFSGNDPEAKNNARRFQCNLCLKKFPYANRLEFHKKTVHSEERTVKCGLCEKMFKTEVEKKVHERTHSDIRPFACRKGCGASYKTRTHCTRHEKQCGI